MTDITLPYNWEARDYQLPILAALDGGVKRALWCVHRRGGKDLTIWNWVIKSLVKKKQICYYVLPTYSQAKKVIWQNQTKDGISFLDFIPPQLIVKKLEHELAVILINGSQIQLIGSDNYDRIMGTSPQIVVFSEFALQNPSAWDYVRPILTENDGVALFISTPRGRNHFYDLYTMAKNNDKWFCQKLTVEDTNAISQEDIQEERISGMSEELIQQEYYVDFNRGIEGSYYGKYMDSMRIQHRIGNVPYDPTARVSVAFDLGIGDSTAVIFYQLIGNEIHIIDCYEEHGKSLSHYAEMLQRKPYVYETYYAPHDIENREMGTGLSRKEVSANLGITFVTLPTLKISIEDGIETVRGLMPRMWIDDRHCGPLIKALENYRKEYDEKHAVYKNKPVHDSNSHFADSFRYACIAIKLYSNYGKISVDEIYARNERNRQMR